MSRADRYASGLEIQIREVGITGNHAINRARQQATYTQWRECASGKIDETADIGEELVTSSHISEAVYAASTLDMKRLESYARRVATSTSITPNPPLFKVTNTTKPVKVTRRKGFLGVRRETITTNKTVKISEQVVARHWVLHRTTHDIETKNRGKIEEYHETNSWVLQEDGRLLYVWDWENFTKWSDGTTRLERDIEVRPMTGSLVARLDYSDRSYEYHDGADHIWGNREQGSLRHHAQGVGLSLRLKRLLEGRPVQ